MGTLINTKISRGLHESPVFNNVYVCRVFPDSHSGSFYPENLVRDP